MDVEVGQPIAVRRLLIGDKPIVVTIGKPKSFPNGEDFYCPYSIEHGGRIHVRYAGGMDAIQALQLVMKMIGSDLAALSRQQGAPISWLSDTPGDTGFPE